MHRHRSPSDREISKKRKLASPLTPSKPKSLPFRAKSLHKNDFLEYKPLLALYLEAQKQLAADELDERELKGRWKSFVKKWNSGELAEGWYDPQTKLKADAESTLGQASASRSKGMEDVEKHPVDSDDDEVGPSFHSRNGPSRRAGPSIPSLQDLEYKDELRAEDLELGKQDLSYTRKTERKLERERLEELVPRAEAGTRERQLEKKRETTALHASFRETKSPGAEEVGESELMGNDGIGGYKKRKLEADKKKNERQLRKEEIWRARAEEREEKLRTMRNKEDKTMDMLKELAKQRFG